MSVANGDVDAAQQRPVASCAQERSSHRPLRPPRGARASRALLATFLGAITLFARSSVRADLDVRPTAQMHIGGAVLDVFIAPGPLASSEAEVVAWISTAAQAVSHYYGRYPVPQARIRIIPRAGESVLSGTTYGSHGGALISVALGESVTPGALARDWVMTHEMVHLALPQVGEDHHWLEEGIATYVEPIARAQVGQLSAETVWGEAVHGMPQGLPGPDDHGLDVTHTWGRTYWGGALFCLLADIQIRERTHNRYGLQDALRGVLAAGGNIEKDWPITRILQIADAAVGVPVLMELHDRMGDRPVAVDLPALWMRLGVVVHDDAVRFDDQAPLAVTRAAITGQRLR